LRVDPTAVVADKNAQLFVRIFYLGFNAACLRVAEGVGQCFVANPVDVITNDRMQWPDPAVDDYAKINRPLHREFLRNPGECLFKIVRAPAGRTQAAKRIPTIVNHLSHYLEYAVYDGLRR
jgi:hypothetical protein